MEALDKASLLETSSEDLLERLSSGFSDRLGRKPATLRVLLHDALLAKGVSISGASKQTGLGFYFLEKLLGGLFPTHREGRLMAGMDERYGKLALFLGLDVDIFIELVTREQEKRLHCARDRVVVGRNVNSLNDAIAELRANLLRASNIDPLDLETYLSDFRRRFLPKTKGLSVVGEIQRKSD